jgi:hypothetical protein
MRDLGTFTKIRGLLATGGDYNKAVKAQITAILLTAICTLFVSLAQEPLRVGIDVKEPRLIKKVDVTYPEAAKIARRDFTNVINVMINERGHIEKAWPLIYEPLTIDATVAAVNQWRFAPSYLNNKAIPVTATLIIVFSLDYVHGNVVFFEGSDGAQYAGVATGLGGPLNTPSIATMSLKGHLHFVSKNPRSAYLQLIPDDLIPFALLEQTLDTGWPEFTSVQLLSSAYRYRNRRLYYSVLLARNNSQLIQLVGADPYVQSPKVELDFDKLSKQVPRPFYPNGMKPRASRREIVFYTMFVDEKGTIIDVDPIGYNENIQLLKNAGVSKPGMRDGVPVPTAVIVAVPVQ